MRLHVILSPSNKWGTKTEYSKLRKFLHKDGYIPIASGVYMRLPGKNSWQKLPYYVVNIM